MPTSASNHQYFNSQIFKENKAALVFDEKNLTPSKLEKKISDLIKRPFLLEQLGQKASVFFKEEAAKNLAKEILNMV